MDDLHRGAKLIFGTHPRELRLQPGTRAKGLQLRDTDHGEGDRAWPSLELSARIAERCSESDRRLTLGCS